jgi:hypothetical protein
MRAPSGGSRRGDGDERLVHDHGRSDRRRDPVIERRAGAQPHADGVEVRRGLAIVAWPSAAWHQWTANESSTSTRTRKNSCGGTATSADARDARQRFDAAASCSKNAVIASPDRYFSCGSVRRIVITACESTPLSTRCRLRKLAGGGRAERQHYRQRRFRRRSAVARPPRAAPAVACRVSCFSESFGSARSPVWKDRQQPTSTNRDGRRQQAPARDARVDRGANPNAVIWAGS